NALMIIGALFVSPSALLANGGASLEGIPGTGSASASDKGHKTEGAIESETLKIDLGPESADVEVHYVMHNTGPKTQQDFFFPVERWGSLPGEETSAPPTGLNNYQIRVDGAELKSSEVQGPKDKAEKSVNLPLWDEKISVIKSWKKSVIPF